MAGHVRDTKPKLESTIAKATAAWQKDLKSLFPPEYHPVDNTLHVEVNMSGGQTSSDVLDICASQAFLSRSANDSKDESTFMSSPICQSPGYLYLEKRYRSIGWRPHQLQEELTTMLQRELYSDVRIIVQDNPHGAFLSHRFILWCRSPYFRDILSEHSGRSTTHPVVVTLPKSIFTPQSFHFILNYIYTGTLAFAEYRMRADNVVHAFDIHRGAVFLGLPDLQNIIIAGITVDMLHGLYCAFLSDEDYLRHVGGDWNNIMKLGCQCSTCAYFSPRVLRFANDHSEPNRFLERGSRRATIGLFGEGWCTPEFSTLPQELFNSILTDIRALITPSSILPLLFKAEQALLKLSHLLDPHGRALAGIVGPRIISVRDSIDQLLCTNADMYFESTTWRTVMKDDDRDDIGIRKEKLAQVGWIMEALSRGVSPQNASAVYQALIYGINLNPQRGNAVLLGSSIRKRIEKMQFEPLQIAQPRFVGRPASAVAAPHGQILRELKERERDAVSEKSSFGSRSSAPSFYSCISTPASVFSLEDTASATYKSYMAALDRAAISLHSLASSRTVSTDYGVYYTRRAISQEKFRDQDSLEGSEIGIYSRAIYN